MPLLNAIQRHAKSTPSQTALHDGYDLAISYAELLSEIHCAQHNISDHIKSATIALAIENSPAWAIMDLAMMANEMPLVPIPGFFSDSQILHAVIDAGASVFITDNPHRYSLLFDKKVIKSTTLTVAKKRLLLLELNTENKALPKGTMKVTYTSGTTGQPKGVCLNSLNMLKVAEAICTSAKLNCNNHHLSVLPLSTLLENIAGLYANLLAGGCTYLLSSARIGFTGSQVDIQLLIKTIKITQAQTAIFIPELLTALIHAYDMHANSLNTLRFLAVGGASVSPDLLKQARSFRLPVFEGYGLSESSSVVTLNTAKENKPGSVGKALPHVTIKISNDNEVLVRGANYLGYIGQEAHPKTWLHTGDIGYLDDEGYLFINGRKKNLFITSYGRNISPEWVERDLTNSPSIAQACLFGEAKPWNTALVVAAPNAHEADIAASIKNLNQQLPDYARVTKWLLATEPFSVNNNQLTSNGRLKRDIIWQHYQQCVETLYTADA